MTIVSAADCQHCRDAKPFPCDAHLAGDPNKTYRATVTLKSSLPIAEHADVLIPAIQAALAPHWPVERLHVTSGMFLSWKDLPHHDRLLLTFGGRHYGDATDAINAAVAAVRGVLDWMRITPETQMTGPVL